MFIRQCAMTLTGGGGGLRITSLKMKFDIDKDGDKNANSAVFWVWNLSDTTRGKLKKEFDRLQFEAGYKDENNVGLIFDGHISDIVHERDNVDIITRIECGDGDKGLRCGTVSKSFDKGTSIKTLIKHAQSGMPDVQEGELRGIDKLPATDRPVVMMGPAFRELDKLGRTHGFLWSIQNGALECCPVNESFDDVVVISKNTGMIGKPSVTDTGIIVQTLLNPKLAVYRQIEVRSDTLEMNGQQSRYRISALKFSGDNGIGDKPGDFIAEIYAEDPAATEKGCAEATSEEGSSGGS